MRLYLTENATHAEKIAGFLDKTPKQLKHYIETSQGLVISCPPKLFQLAEPHAYHQKWSDWRLQDLPIIPEKWLWLPKKNHLDFIRNIEPLIKSADQIVLAVKNSKESQLNLDNLLLHAGVHPYPQNDADQQQIKRYTLTDMEALSALAVISNIPDNLSFRALANAARCRQKSDWLYGVNMSRLLTLIANEKQLLSDEKLTVGRLQTPVIGLITQGKLDQVSGKHTPYSEEELIDTLEVINHSISDPLILKTLHDKQGLGSHVGRKHLIENLYMRDYIIKNAGKLELGEKGKVLTELLPETLLNPDLATIWDARLSTVEQGSSNVEEYLNNFVEELSKQITAVISKNYLKQENTIKDQTASNSLTEFPPITTKIYCPECDDPMRLQLGRYGPFYSCTRYPECKGKRQFKEIFVESITPSERQHPPLSAVLNEQVPCPECHAALIKRKGKYGDFWGCSNFPKCKCTLKDVNGTPNLKSFYFGK